MKVALSYDYLWINLRVKGGAYGCMSGFKRSGESYFVSYRDPHLRRTLEVYEGVPEYVRTFAADEREMTKYIIGTISGKACSKNTADTGALAEWLISAVSLWRCCKKSVTRSLNATSRGYPCTGSARSRQFFLDDQLCVVGSENAIEKAKDVLMEIKPLVSC
ncbi:MAG: hypothetical protein ACLU6Y_13005 [Ruminococcus sp.]